MKPGILFTLEKPRILRYNMTALSLLEDHFDSPIAEFLPKLKKLKLSQLTVCLWAGLRHEDKDITPEQIMEMLDNADNPTKMIEESAQALSKAMTEAFGKN